MDKDELKIKNLFAWYNNLRDDVRSSKAFVDGFLKKELENFLATSEVDESWEQILIESRKSIFCYLDLANAHIGETLKILEKCQKDLAKKKIEDRKGE